MNYVSTGVLCLLAAGLAGNIPGMVGQHVDARQASYLPSEIDAAKESIALSLMGQLQLSVGDLMWLKSLEYTHRGLVTRMPTRGEEAAGYMPKESSDTARGMDHQEGVNMVLDKKRDWRGVVGDIHRNVSCHVEGHGHDDPVELIPWYQLAVKLNPRLERLYTLGAFFMSDSARAPGDARAMLEAGLAANPRSFEIHASLGRLLFEYAERLDELRAHHHSDVVAAHDHHGDLDNEHNHDHLAEGSFLPTSTGEAQEMAAVLLREAIDLGLELRLEMRERRERFDDFQDQVHGESYLFLARALTALQRYDDAIAVCDEGMEFSGYHLLAVQQRIAARRGAPPGGTGP